MAYCSICHRPLSDKTSIQRGIDPDCWAKLQSLEHRPYHGLGKRRARADYEYDVTDDRIIVIIDRDLGRMSVTNDIENVLADITAQEGLPQLSGYLVVYRDSMGRWDEVVLGENARFRQFVGNGGATEQEALAILRTRYNR